MEYKIKPATIDDLKSIQELNLMLFEKEHKGFDSTLDCKWTFSEDGENYFRKRITEDDGCVFVACANDKIVGYLAGGLSKKSLYRELPNFAELENMFISSEYRGAGIGSKLFQAFVGWCKTKEVGRLRVVTSAQNTDGVNFYRKNGFIDYDLILEKNI